MFSEIETEDDGGSQLQGILDEIEGGEIKGLFGLCGDELIKIYGFRLEGELG